MLAKSKLNSIETVMSHALINIKISHEEFIPIFKEKDKYEKRKENLRSENEKQEIMRLRKIWVNRNNSGVESDVANQAQRFDKCDLDK